MESIKPQHPSRLRSLAALSLVEVAIALGIVSFTIVALLGLFPSILSEIRESRENTVRARIFHAVEQDLLENPPAVAELTRDYYFDREGFSNSLPDAFFQATLEHAFDSTLPGGGTNGSLILSRVALINRVQNSTNLQRPIWSVRGPQP